MRKYAIWGTATSPAHEAWVVDRRRRSRPTDSPGSTTSPTPTSCSTCSTRSSRRRSGASRAGTYSASFYELDEVPDDVLKTSYPMLVRTLANVVVLHVPGHGRVVHDDGARHLQDLGRAAGGLRAARAAREVEARDRQRVRPRPRARALGRRRGHRGHRRWRASGCRTSTCCPRRSRCTSTSTSATSAT